MRYPFHTTTEALRNVLTYRGEFYTTEINVDDFLINTIAYNEDEDKLYDVDYVSMEETLKQFDDGVTDFKETAYYKRWKDIKGEDYCERRINKFHELYSDIRIDGLKEPIAVEQTGQKIDGSHRCAIYKHLGYKTIPAKVYNLLWEDIDEAFIKRTLEAREKLYGKNYYFIDYGNFVNYQGIVSDIYKENSYDRWEALKDLIYGNTIDIGCNEGFIAIQNGLKGNPTIGYEYEFAHGANFNKIIFEYLNNRELPVMFFDKDVTEMKVPECDTCLMLNVIYHIPQEKQVKFLQGIKAKQIIFQCNLRKAHEAYRFRGCTVEGVKELCELSGHEIIKVIEWRDKPIVIAK